MPRNKGNWQWKVDDPIFSRNLVILPLRNEKVGRDGWVTLTEGIRRGLVELEETGNINLVRITTPPNPFIVIDGEQVEGAYQDRMFVTSFFTRGRKKLEVPVACVEAGRWNGDATFKSASHIAPPSVRATTQISLSIRRKGQDMPRVDQSKVWQSVSHILEASKSTPFAPTKSLSAGHKACLSETRSYRVAPLFAKPRKEYEEARARWLDNIPVLPDQVGVIFMAGGRFLSLDIMGSPTMFFLFYERLLEAAALEAYALQDAAPPPSLRGDGLEERAEEALRFARSFPQWRACSAVADGSEKRTRGRKYIGKVLMDASDLVHLSVHPRPSEEGMSTVKEEH
ncbi:MAG: ARPP-1 family domain-containing protein [bacterium JZ-2024 1]